MAVSRLKGPSNQANHTERVDAAVFCLPGNPDGLRVLDILEEIARTAAAKLQKPGSLARVDARGENAIPVERKKASSVRPRRTA